MNHKDFYPNSKNSYRSHETKKIRQSNDFGRYSRKNSNNSNVFHSVHTPTNNSGPALTTNNQKEYNSYSSYSSQEDNGIRHPDDFGYQSNNGKHGHSMHSLYPPVSRGSDSMHSLYPPVSNYKESENHHQDKTYYHDDYSKQSNSFRSEEFSRSSIRQPYLRRSEHKMHNSYSYSGNEQKKQFNKNWINDDNFQITIKNDQVEHQDFYDAPKDSVTTERHSLDFNTNLYERKDLNYSHSNEIHEPSHKDRKDYGPSEIHHYENEYNRRNSFEHTPGYRSLVGQTSLSPNNDKMFYEDYQNSSSKTHYRDSFLHDRDSTNFQRDDSFNSIRDEMINRDDVNIADDSNLGEHYKKGFGESHDNIVHSSIDDVKRTLNIRDIKKILDIVEQFPSDNINKLSNIILEKGRKMIDDEKNAMKYSNNTSYLHEDNIFKYGDKQSSHARNHRNSTTEIEDNYFEKSNFDESEHFRRKPFIDQTEDLTEKNTLNRFDRRYQDKELLRRDRERSNSFQSGRFSKNSKTIDYEAKMYRRGRSDSPYTDKLNEKGNAEESDWLLNDSLYSKEYKYKDRIRSQTTYQEKTRETVKERGHLRNAFHDKVIDQESSLKSKKTFKVDQDSNESRRPSKSKSENRIRDRKTSIEAMLIEAGNKAVSKKDGFPTPIFIHAPIAPSIGVPIQQVFPVDQSFQYPRFSIIPNYLTLGNLKPGNVLSSGIRFNGIFNNSNNLVVPQTSTSNYLSAPLIHGKSNALKSSNFKKFMIETSKKKDKNDFPIRNDRFKSSNVLEQKLASNDDSVKEDHSAPKRKSIKKRFPKWFDEECRQLYIKRRKLKVMLKRAKHFPNDKNNKGIPQIEEQFNQVKKVLLDKIRCLKTNKDSAQNKDHV